MEQPDEHLQQREAEKADALAAVDAAIATFDALRCNPDRWERVHLVRALISVFSGCYGIALTDARLTVTPLTQRVEALLPHDPVFDQCDLPMLIQLTKAARAEPVRRFPHFGPIEVPLPPRGTPSKSWRR
jgi:hypothetical protein